MSAPKLSLRSEMSSRNSTNVSDIRKQSLFGIMDKDGGRGKTKLAQAIDQIPKLPLPGKDKEGGR